MDDADPRRRSSVVDALASRHPLFARQTIERLVTSVFDRYRHAKIQAFVPILVRREVETRLRYLDHDHHHDHEGPEHTVVRLPDQAQIHISA